MSSIGENIKEFRERLGMSQEDLGRRIGKTRSAVSQYEAGKIVPRMGVIEDLALALMVDKGAILGTATKTRATSDEDELVSLYRRMSATKRSALLSMARAMLED